MVGILYLDTDQMCVRNAPRTAFGGTKDVDGGVGRWKWRHINGLQPQVCLPKWMVRFLTGACSPNWPEWFPCLVNRELFSCSLSLKPVFLMPDSSVAVTRSPILMSVERK